MDKDTLLIRQLGLRDYQDVADAMGVLTDRRDRATPDEIWLLEHRPVFTLGRAAREEHVLDAGAIPVVRTDRGGQVTYHGPGQLVVYLLLDLQRRGIGIRHLVQLLEDTVIELLSGHGVAACRRPGAPGVYVGDRKIAALGLRVRRGCSYHGLSLNVAMDLAPFNRINPCGFPGLEATQLMELADIGPGDLPHVGETLTGGLTRRLQYDKIQAIDMTLVEFPPGQRTGSTAATQ